MLTGVRDAAAMLFDQRVYPRWEWGPEVREIREAVCDAAEDRDRHAAMKALIIACCGNPDAASAMITQCNVVVAAARDAA